MAQYDVPGNLFNPGTFAPNPEGNFLVDALGAQSTGYLASVGEANQPQTPPYKSMTTEVGPDGQLTHTFKGVSDVMVQRLQRQMQFADSAQKALSQLAEAALRKREVLQQHPLLSEIGRIGSAVASQYVAPGSRGQAIVRGLGAFGGEFFQDTPEELLMRAAQAREQQFNIEGRVVDQLEQQRRFDIQEGRAKEELQLRRESGKREEEQIQIARNREKAYAQDKATTVYEVSAGKGNAGAGEAFRLFARTRPDLFTLEEVEERAKGLELIAQGYKQQQRDLKELEVWRYKQQKALAAIAAAPGIRAEKLTQVVTGINRVNDDVQKITEAALSGERLIRGLGISAGVGGKDLRTQVAEINKMLLTTEGQTKLGLTAPDPLTGAPVPNRNEIADVRMQLPKALAAVEGKDAALKAREAERTLLKNALTPDQRAAYGSALDAPLDAGEIKAIAGPKPQSDPAVIAALLQQDPVANQIKQSNMTPEQKRAAIEARIRVLTEGGPKPAAAAPAAPSQPKTQHEKDLEKVFKALGLTEAAAALSAGPRAAVEAFNRRRRR